ncbi:tyrosine-type recombinase/integrase [Alicyclobacillus sp. SO9]|uniref:tyrosine-type recombinase/integrase n=1 Tax=Alicyclobacillus sp. SO9 TaxID=2665646 RepID=UPI0018E707AB|nr:tyrosine-type recombinase/integrase [Alicyclobacillus sp. SO9]QQE78439.1 tyrosine-type recombinase/integrase [Alicyclobacillus sp. SO9]
MKIDDRFFRLVRDFLLIYLPKNRCCSQNTVKAYRDTIHLLQVFMKEQKRVPFAKITFDRLNHALVSEFLDWLQTERKCRVSTRNHRLAALKSFFKYAAQEDASLMFAYVELGKVPVKRQPGRRVSYMSESGLAALLQEPDEGTKRGIRDRFFMIFLYDTGARIQEVLDLQLGDLHLKDSVPCVYLTGKRQKTRVVPLLNKTLQHLELYLQHFHPKEAYSSNNSLFYTVINGKTGKMSPDNVASFLKRYGASARLRCSEVPERVYPHLFRHTRAMHLYQSGMPLSYIKDFLGHASVNTTDIYASADVSMLKAALERTYVNGDIRPEIPVWEDNEELLLHLCGLQ